MTELEKLQKLLDLAKNNPEKLDNLLAELEQAEAGKPLNKKQLLKREVVQQLVKSLGPGILKYLK